MRSYQQTKFPLRGSDRANTNNVRFDVTLFGFGALEYLVEWERRIVSLAIALVTIAIFTINMTTVAAGLRI
jgi:hypothetical protein